MSPRRTFGLLALVAAIALTVVALRGESSPAETGGQPLATPVWSPRRVPDVVAAAASGQRLQARLDALTAGQTSCFVVEGAGATLAAKEADTPLVPASTMKLLTAAAALDTLGPDTTFHTRVVAPAAPVDGVVGRLWLVGGGDPMLATPEGQARLQRDARTRDEPTTPLAQLADAVVAAGVRRVDGGIAGDDSRHEPLQYLPTWDPGNLAAGEMSRLAALTVDGGIAATGPGGAVDDPAAYAAGQLGRLLVARGVVVAGGYSHQSAPDGSVEVADLPSPPVRSIVAADLTSSNNLASELLIREIGLRAVQEGSTAAGTRAALARLARLGVPTTGVTMVDGSGLDRGDRATCRALLATLALGSRTPLRTLWDGLAVAGRTGTLADEMRGSVVTGRVRAKTGTLDGVSGLVGFADLARPLRFAYLVNGYFGKPTGYALRARFAEALATYPEAPADLVPLPTPPAPGLSSATDAPTGTTLATPAP